MLLAVSGGPDSVALARLLSESYYRLELAHFDHALREDSAEDASFVEALAESLSLPFHQERAEVARIAEAKGWNLEDAARRLRYAFLTRTAKRVGAGAVVTGHTQDDQAETVLMQLLRGAAFLKGMPARRGRVIRPLLGLSRRELLSYLHSIDQPFNIDPTNRDVSRTRAWLRYEVLPLLESRYPSVKETLARFAALQTDQAEHLTLEAARLLEDDAILLRRLLSVDSSVQRQAIAVLLEREGVPADLAHIETIRGALFGETPRRVSLPRDYLARVAYGRLELVRPGRADTTITPATLLPAEVDPDKAAAFPDLVYRSRRPGDRIGLPGGAKKLSDLLIDRKVPREARDSLKLLASGSDVLWVEGLVTDPRVARRDQPDPDIPWMKLALDQARQAADRGEAPIGAVVVREDEAVGVGHNATETEGDPTAHAELRALRQAAERLNDWRLEGCTLYVTLEPCPMCFGACLQAHLPRLVYGAPNRREGALGSVADLRNASWKRELDVRGGVLEKEAAKLLSEFFRARRSEESTEP